MNWDEQLIKACTETDGTQHPHTDHVLTGAKWMREQLRTDEAVEIAVNAMYEDEFGQSSEYAAKWVLDTYRPIARAAIEALLGDN